MTRIFNNVDTVYRFRDFFIDICEDYIWNPCEYHAWLYHKDYGIKMFMFGLPAEDVTFEEFVDIVDKNLDDHIKIYKDRFIDEKR